MWNVWCILYSALQTVINMYMYINLPLDTPYSIKTSQKIRFMYIESRFFTVCEDILYVLKIYNFYYHSPKILFLLSALQTLRNLTAWVKASKFSTLFDPCLCYTLVNVSFTYLTCYTCNLRFVFWGVFFFVLSWYSMLIARKKIP